MLRIGVDTGGTFTDFVWLEDGRRRTLKVPSTPEDPSRAVLSGLEALLGAQGDGQRVRLPSGSTVIHGSTVATNALLEGKGASVALLATAGFEDLLEIGRQGRPALYDPSVFPPEPLVPREGRIGVTERLGPGGDVIVPLDREALRRDVAQAIQQGHSRFAICFLHSYADPRHEELAGEIVREAGGEATLSSRILPEYREYERASTTVVNAALVPIMRATSSAWRTPWTAPGSRFSAPTGGILSARHAGEEAVQTLLSGPAAGVLGAWEWARAGGLERLITFDMGGTSTDVSLCDGAVTLTTEAEVGGHPVRLPMVDIHTVGAGGGSLARRDTGGALLVGPQSAGADPGPACYGKGNRPTVTDAQLVLGRIRAERFLGGRMPLQRERAEEAVGRLARELDLSLLETAAGIVRVANAGMERAIRVVSLARGHDPRRFALFCFGGAGGLHAADLARGLGIPEVIIPPDAGTFSAFGMMAADVVRDASRAVLEPLPAVGRTRRDRLAEPLEECLRKEMQSEGFDGEDVVLRRNLDLRYHGQSFELTVPEGEDPSASFHDLHRRRYGHDRPAVEVELVAIRVRAVGQVPTPPVETRPEGPPEPPPPDEEARVWFRDGLSTTGVHERRHLAPGHRLDGPAVVTEAGATTVVPPGWKLRMDGHENLRLAPEGD